jgi:transcriptional regulator GlxA family with amidase domain
MILAASGILDGGPATTKREVVPPEISPLEIMRAAHPQIDVREAMLVEGRGGIVTGGGVTLCIDTTLHLLADVLGDHVAEETARIMEYQRAWRANHLKRHEKFRGRKNRAESAIFLSRRGRV